MNKSENTCMYILSAFGIIFILLGHISSSYIHTELFTFYGWIPYYSFHMPLFLKSKKVFINEYIN